MTKTTAAPKGGADNLSLWNAVADIDPEYTKPITGRQYKGTSPNPTYLIRLATEKLGPVGFGFGWKIVAERYIDQEPIVPIEGQRPICAQLHECLIEFWWRDPATGEKSEPISAYGQTRALYKSSKGNWMADEDAPKKSLTDAIIKAMSWLGFAGNIFLGRWDDQKYVAELREQFANGGDPEAPVTPSGAPTAKREASRGDQKPASSGGPAF